MFLGLFGDVDLLVIVLGSADDLDDRDRCSIDIVYYFYLIVHCFENCLYF